MEISLRDRFERRLDSELSLAFIDKLKKQLPALELYLVGGMTRDIIINAKKYKTDKVTSKDYDFIARGVEIDALISALEQLGTVDLVGRNFGVLKFVPTDSSLEEAIDIALPRTDFSAGTGGYKDVKTQSDPSLPVETDLARRDLTINAIAYDVLNKEIIDPFHGQEDLNNKVIRAVGKPAERFQEDYSRMLRALRLACRFDFEIEAETWAGIVELMTHLSDTRLNDKKKKEFVVPRETVSKEMIKAFKENPARAMDLFDQSGAFAQIMPEVLNMKACPQPHEYHNEGDVWQHTRLMLSLIKSPDFKKQFPDDIISGEFVLGVLLHDVAKPVTLTMPAPGSNDRMRYEGHDTEGARMIEEIGKRLNMSAEQYEKMAFMTRQHMFTMSADKIKEISNAKLARRFIDSPHSRDLLRLFWLDSVGSLRGNGSYSLYNFQETVKKINEILEIRANQPTKIITGEEIMALLGIKPGLFVGVMIEVLSELKDRAEINSEEDAKNWITEHKTMLLDWHSRTTLQDRKEAIADQILATL